MPMSDTGNLSPESVSAWNQERFGQSQKTPASGWVPPLGQWPTVGLWLSTPSQKAEGLSGALKITQHGMVKKRSYGSIWLSVFISLCPSISLSLSLTLMPSVTPFKRIKTRIYSL